MSRAPGPSVVALVVFGVALWAQSDALVGVFYDDGIYVVGAKALATGAGYGNIHLPDPLPIVHYPFLYPAALSLLWRVWPVFPQNVALFELFDATALAAAAWVVTAHARRLGVSGWVACAATVLGFTAFPVLTIVGLRLSEPLFLFLAAGAVAVADGDRNRARDAVFAGALAGLATLTRSIGVAFMAGVVAAVFLRGGPRRAMLAGAVAVAVVLPWTVWVTLHGQPADPALQANYGTYLSEAREAGLAAMIEGLDLRALGALGGLALPRLPGPLWYGAGTLLLVGLGTGAVTTFRRAPALIVGLGLYVLIVSLWPYPPHRFMWITLPWVALLLATGCRVAWGWGSVGRAAVIVAIALLVWGFGRRQVVSLTQRGFAVTAEGISQSLRVLVGSIRVETPPGAIIAVEDEALVHLYTGRTTVPSYVFRWRGRGTEPLDAEAAAAFFCRARVTHVALTGPAAQTAPPVARLLARPDSTLVPVFQVTGGASLHAFRCPA
ncbi:MAG TPA: hypothetical protein VF970_09815 [Gemmatimonadales bacterium]